MGQILWDGESVFPEKVKVFKSFLCKYLASLNKEDLLTSLSFDYDLENDEFLNADIQAYYHLWSVS